MPVGGGDTGEGRERLRNRHGLTGKPKDGARDTEGGEVEVGDGVMAQCSSFPGSQSPGWDRPQGSPVAVPSLCR